MRTSELLSLFEDSSSCSDPQRNGEASHADVNGAIDAVVNKKLNNYRHDYNARNYFFLSSHDDLCGESVETFSVCFTYCLIAKQRTISQEWVSSTFHTGIQQRRGTYSARGSCKTQTCFAETISSV